MTRLLLIPHALLQNAATRAAPSPPSSSGLVLCERRRRFGASTAVWGCRGFPSSQNDSISHSGAQWVIGMAAGILLAGATSPAGVYALPVIADNLDSTPLRDFRETRVAPGRLEQPRQASPNQQNGVSVREQVADILKLTNDARFATDSGNYAQALAVYSSIVDKYPDFAITDYARLDRALLLFQNGNRSRAILELEDLEFTEKGSAELSAAVAAALYAERPQLLSRAESEWRIVEAFDRRYYDLDWVRSQKHWPPAMLDALGRFLRLDGT